MFDSACATDNCLFGRSLIEGSHDQSTRAAA
jgi:hypothetical protein